MTLLRKIFFCFTFLLILSSNISEASSLNSIFHHIEPIPNELIENRSYIGKYSYHLKKTNSADSYKEILQEISSFQRQNDEIPNFGYSSEFHWFIIRIKNNYNKEKIYFLNYEYPLMQSVDVFKVCSNNVVDHRQQRKNSYLSEKEFGIRDFIFEFKITSNEDCIFIFKLKTTGAVSLPIKIFDKSSLVENKSKSSFFYGLYFGGLLFLGLYNLFIFLYLRDSTYLYYVGYLFFLGFSQLGIYGFSYEIILGNNPDLNTPIVVFSAPLTLFFLSIFTYYFIPFKRTFFPKIVIGGLLLLNLTIFIIALFSYNKFVISLTGLTASLTPIVLFVLALFALREKSRESFFFTISLGVFLIGSFLYGLKDFNVIKANFISINSLLIGSSVEIILLSLGLADRIQSLRKSKDSLLLSLAKSDAVARTTQGLAHDIRRPFSMLKMVLNAMSSAEDPAEAKQIAAVSLPEVNQAMVSVEGMIQDVMQIGSTSKPNQENASPETIIYESLNQLFRIFPEADVAIEYDLNHEHCLFVDTIRVGRVFSNILVNALQAIEAKGNIWIKTKENAGFVEFRLGNSGSCIAPENLPKLFDAFFTSEKKGGTGLGLAIAQKVVVEHDGKIFCESEKTEKFQNGYVEFVFTLPVSLDVNPARSEPLPKHSREIHEQILLLKKKESNYENTDDLQIETAVLNKLKAFSDSIPPIVSDPVNPTVIAQSHRL